MKMGMNDMLNTDNSPYDGVGFILYFRAYVWISDRLLADYDVVIA